MAYQADIQLKIQGLDKLKQIDKLVGDIKGRLANTTLTVRTTQANKSITALNKQVTRLKNNIRSIPKVPSVPTAAPRPVGGRGPGGLRGAAAAIIAASFVTANPAEARTCIKLYNSGDRVCLHSVYSNGGSQKTVVVSVNGSNPSSHNINCSRPTWESNSIFDRACSDYSLVSY